MFLGFLGVNSTQKHLRLWSLLLPCTGLCPILRQTGSYRPFLQLPSFLSHFSFARIDNSLIFAASKSLIIAHIRRVVSRTCMRDTTVGGIAIEKVGARASRGARTEENIGMYIHSQLYFFSENTICFQGTAVVVDTYAVHFSMELWGENADRFRPERWVISVAPHFLSRLITDFWAILRMKVLLVAQEMSFWTSAERTHRCRWMESDNRPAASNFLAFGAGPRLCIEMRFSCLFLVHTWNIIQIGDGGREDGSGPSLETIWHSPGWTGYGVDRKWQKKVINAQVSELKLIGSTTISPETVPVKIRTRAWALQSCISFSITRWKRKNILFGYLLLRVLWMFKCRLWL